MTSSLASTYEAAALKRRKTLEAAEADLASWREQLDKKRRQGEEQSEQERRRLREEVNAGRRARAEREGTPFEEIPATPDPSTSTSGRFDFPIFSPTANYAATPKRNEQRTAAETFSFDKLRANVPGSTAGKGGQSLASFMGGKASGPILNKPKPLNEHGLEVDSAPVPSFLSAMHKERVALPGMVPGKAMTMPKAPVEASPAPLTKQTTGSRTWPPPDQRNKSPSLSEQELAQLTKTSPVTTRRTSFDATTKADSAARISPDLGSAAMFKQRSGEGTFASRRTVSPAPLPSSSFTATSSSPALPAPSRKSPFAAAAEARAQAQATPTSSPSVAKSQDDTPAKSMPLPGRSATVPQPSWEEKPATNSILRLQNSSIVKQRLEAAGQTSPAAREAKEEEPVVPSSLSKRTSVMDRWAYDDRPASTPPSPQTARYLPQPSRGLPSTFTNSPQQEKPKHAKRASVLDRWGFDATKEEEQPQPVALPGMTRPGSRPPIVRQRTEETAVEAKPLVHLTKERPQGPRRNTPRASTTGITTSSSNINTASPPLPSSSDATSSLSRTTSVRPERVSRPSTPVKRELPSPTLASASPTKPSVPHPSSRVALPGLTKSAPSIHPMRPAPLSPGAEASSRFDFSPAVSSKPETSPRLDLTSAVEPAPRRSALSIARDYQAGVGPKPAREAPVPPSPKPSTSTGLHRRTDINFDKALGRPVASTSPYRGELLNVESLALMADGIKTLEGREAHTFYLQELVAVVARYRSADRTIQTRLLVWRGSGSNASRGEGKLKELEDRYRMQADLVHAGRETSDFVKLVGGVVVVRHGQRARFDPINTALYRVQAIGEAVFVDEVDLQADSVCSAHCYVLSMGVLRSVIVWQGRGSTETEKQRAEEHGRELTKTGSKFVVERETDMRPSSLFAQTLGLSEDQPHAAANHWRYRTASTPPMQLYMIDNAIETSDGLMTDRVALVDAHFDLWVIVPEACSTRLDHVALALDAAEHLAAKSSLKPAIHALLFPTLLPSDLSCQFRTRDLLALNGSSSPREMRLLDLEEARARFC